MKPIVPNKKIEQKLQNEGFKTIAGLDEVGRGAIAGPLVSCAVILPKQNIYKIRDSKLLNFDIRKKLAQKLKKIAIYSISLISARQISEHGMAWALKESYNKALVGLKIKPQYVLIDGIHKIKECQFEHKAIVKGDKKIASISAASIIAKDFRDRLMIRYAKKFPNYGFEKHKGYGTKYHYQMLKIHGLSGFHRKYQKIINIFQ